MTLASIKPDNDRARWAALALIVTAQFMVVLDVAIVNVALPAIETDLHFSQENLQWVITAYAILFGGALLLGGRLADVFGRRRVFVAGILLFGLASLLSGLAWSEGSLIGFRGLQGLAGALLAPASLAILMTTFAEGRERNIALGIWGAASGSGGAAGVLLGGVLTSYVGWTWIFFINIPVAVAIVVLAPWLLRESRVESAHRRFDVAGAVTVTSGLMLLVYAMTRAPEHGWGSGSTIALLAASVVLVLAFLLIELRSQAPLLPLRMFRSRTLAAANAAGVVVAAVAFSMFFVLTLYMQQVLHYSPIQTGLGFVAMAGTIVAFSTFAQSLVTRFGARRTLTTGLLLAAVSLAYLTQLPEDGHYFWNLFPALVLAGVAMSMSFIAMTIAALTGVGREDAGIASGLVTTSRQIGGAVGLAAVSTIAAAFGGNGASATDLTRGFDVAFWVLTGTAVVGALIAAIFIEPQRRPATAEPVTEELTFVLEEAA
jgi:EmrB/QacA subfamily drug resistance transporter